MNDTAFPWFTHLSEDELFECLRELKNILASEDSWEYRRRSLYLAVNAWKATAQVKADGLPEILKTPTMDDFGEVQRPSGDVQVVSCEPTARVVRVLLPHRAGVVEIEPDLLEGASGHPVIRVDVISDAKRYGAADDGRFYEVVNQTPGPGVVFLIGQETPNE